MPALVLSNFSNQLLTLWSNVARPRSKGLRALLLVFGLIALQSEAMGQEGAQNASADGTSSAVLGESSRGGVSSAPLELATMVTLGGAQTVNALAAAGSQWTSLNASLTHASSQVGLTAYLGYTRSVSEDASSIEMDHPAFALSKSWEFEQGFLKQVSGGVASVFPGNRQAWDNTFRFALGPYVEVGAESGRWTLNGMLSVSQGAYDLSPEVFEGAGLPSHVIKAGATIDYSLSSKLTAELAYQYFAPFANGAGKESSHLWNLLAIYEVRKGLLIDGGIGNSLLSGVPNGHFDQLAGSSQPAQVVFLDWVMSL